MELKRENVPADKPVQGSMTEDTARKLVARMTFRQRVDILHLAGIILELPDTVKH